MTKKPKRPDESERLSQANLGPIITYAAAHKGTYTALANALGDAMGKPLARQQVEQWLHPDPYMRVQPRYGIGLLLVKLGAELIAKAEGGFDREWSEAKKEIAAGKTEPLEKLIGKPKKRARK